MRLSSSGIIRSGPSFWSISRPEIDTATAACVMENCAAVNTSDGEMFNVS